MHADSGAAGLAALSICESILLSLIENKIIDATEAKAILEDAANAHREAAPLMDDDSDADRHAQVAALIASLIAHGNSVRYADRSREPRH
jgi:hypothetical protein